MTSTTVRVSEPTHRTLRELSEQLGESMQRILDQAIEDYRRKRVLERTNAGYAALAPIPRHGKRKLPSVRTGRRLCLTDWTTNDDAAPFAWRNLDGRPESHTRPRTGGCPTRPRRLGRHLQPRSGRTRGRPPSHFPCQGNPTSRRHRSARSRASHEELRKDRRHPLGRRRTPHAAAWPGDRSYDGPGRRSPAHPARPLSSGAGCRRSCPPLIRKIRVWSKREQCKNAGKQALFEASSRRK